MECLGDGICTNPRCPRHGVRPVEPAKQCTCDPGPEGQHRHWCDLREGLPPEPAGVGDEAVEAAARAIYTCPPGRRLEPWGAVTGKMREEYLQAGRAALVAAQRVRPQVVASREAVRRAIADELDSEGIVAYGLTPKLTDAVFTALTGG